MFFSYTSVLKCKHQPDGLKVNTHHHKNINSNELHLLLVLDKLLHNYDSNSMCCYMRILSTVAFSDWWRWAQALAPRRSTRALWTARSCDSAWEPRALTSAQHSHMWTHLPQYVSHRGILHGHSRGSSLRVSTSVADVTIALTH